MEYVYLGEDITDGLFAWISVGVNPKEDNEVIPSAYYTEEGGVENEDAGIGMGMGGGGDAPPGASSVSGMMMPSTSPLVIAARRLTSGLTRYCTSPRHLFSVLFLSARLLSADTPISIRRSFRHSVSAIDNIIKYLVKISDP